mmetsp:Transcript_56544/g.175407  ORF Transcript_56544/g.175407 Transcript_56544/m.175407 type:complete len:220 (+) Transcript_56544:163-822(+)
MIARAHTRARAPARVRAHRPPTTAVPGHTLATLMLSLRLETSWWTAWKSVWTARDSWVSCSCRERTTNPTWTTSLLRGSPRRRMMPPISSSSCNVPPPSASSTSKRPLRSSSGTSRSSRSCCASGRDIASSKTSFEIFVLMTASESLIDCFWPSGSFSLWHSQRIYTKALVFLVCRSWSERRLRMRKISLCLAVDSALSTKVAMIRLKIPKLTNMMTAT